MASTNTEIRKNLTGPQYLRRVNLDAFEVVEFLKYFNLHDLPAALAFFTETVEYILKLSKADRARKKNKAIVKFAKANRQNKFAIMNSAECGVYFVQCAQDRASVNREMSFAQSSVRVTEATATQTTPLKIKFTCTLKRGLDGEEETSPPKRVFKEVDGVRFDGLEESLGTQIGVAARNMDPAQNGKKKIYFQTCGMNGIIDLSDRMQDSQLYGFTDKTQGEIVETLSRNSYKIKNIIACSEYNKVVNKAAEAGIDVYESLQELDGINCSQHLYPSKCIYRHILLNIVYPLKVNTFSEADYVVEIWGPLIKYIFLGTPLCSHWGDTVPLHLKNNSPVYFKLDLRIVDTTGSQVDWAVGEAGINVVNWKYFTDKTKLILTAKSQLNELVKSYPSLTRNTLSKIKIPFIQILGLNAVVFFMELHANGLYKIVQIISIECPITKACLESGKLSDLIEGLSALKDLSLRLLNVTSDLEKSKKVNEKKKMDRSMNENNNSNGGDYVVSWIRDLWFPPNFDSGTEE